jgi:class 3 adenylate cyclase
MRTENLAVMLTDMKGFTAATTRQSREENARMLAVHDELVLPVVRAFGGRRVKTMGDANLVLFGSPTSGLLCGMAIQDRLWDYGRQVAEAQRIEVRVVLSLGEVRLEGPAAAPSDVYGEAVNLAARVEAEAEAGQVWFTEAVRLVADRSQIPEEELGALRLKGIDEEVRLFRVPYANQRGDRPPYGNAALSRVVGLAPPQPERLARALRRRRSPIFRLGRALAEALVALPLRPALVAVVLVALLAGGWRFVATRTERLIGSGAFDEAAAAIEARAAERGGDDPAVLYLRGRLAAARADAGQGGSVRQAFTFWSRAVAQGSGDALDVLEEAAESWECDRRRLAAHALSDSLARSALPALRRLSEAEPPPADAAARVRRFLGADGLCGAGDVAREGIRVIEAGRQ